MKKIGAAALALGLLVAACGDGNTAGGDERPNGSEEGTPQQDREMELSDELVGDADFVLVTSETREDPSGKHGYALEGEEVTSPGPTLRLQEGEEVTIVLENMQGQHSGEPYPGHNFVVVPERRSDAEPLWGAAIGEKAPVLPGERGAVTFTPDASGRFFYICSLPGHLSIHGMWGRVVVEE